MKKNIAVIITAMIFIIVFALALSPPSRRFISSIMPTSGSETKTTKEKDQETYAREESGIPRGRRIVLTLAEATDLSAFEGKLFSNHALLGKYGKYADETLRNYPTIVSRVRRAKSNFRANQVGDSSPSKAARLNDQREFLVMSGSTPPNQAGTRHVIAYDPQSGKAYVLKENYTMTKVTIYGNPDPKVMGLLTHYYLRQ